MLHARPLVPLALTVGLTAVAGCGGETASGSAGSATTAAAAPSSPAAEARTVAGAREAATEMFAAYAAGDYGAAWDRWASKTRKTMGRDAYLRLNKLCRPAAEGIPFKVKKVRLEGGVAIVRASRLTMAFTYRFAYEGGRWRYMAQEQVLAEYRSGTVEEIAADRKKNGRCAA